jgi:hypothetical protein
VHGRGQGIKTLDLMAPRPQDINDVGADEASRPRHQYTHTSRQSCGQRVPILSQALRHSFVRVDHGSAALPSLAMRIDVILPCLNEAAALPWVLARVPAPFHPVVVDNGSTDASASIAADHGATVVVAPQRGFGAACHAGLLAATSEVVCFMDADASLDPRDLPLVAGPVLTGMADLVLGRRMTRGRGCWPLHARLGNKVLAAELRRRTGVGVRDLGPMRCAHRAGLLGLGLADRRFGYPLEMVMAAAMSNWRIREVCVPYLPRSGRSKVTGTMAGTVRTVRDMRRVLAS